MQGSSITTSGSTAVKKDHLADLLNKPQVKKNASLNYVTIPKASDVYGKKQTLSRNSVASSLRQNEWYVPDDAGDAANLRKKVR